MKNHLPKLPFSTFNFIVKVIRINNMLMLSGASARNILCDIMSHELFDMNHMIWLLEIEHNLCPTPNNPDFMICSFNQKRICILLCRMNIKWSSCQNWHKVRKCITLIPFEIVLRNTWTVNTSYVGQVMAYPDSGHSKSKVVFLRQVRPIGI